MKQSIILDDIYLRAFTWSGIRSGIFKSNDFNRNFRKLCCNFSLLSLLVHQILLLYDKVEFISDTGESDGPILFDNCPILLEEAIPYRLYNFINNINGPDKLHINMSNLVDQEKYRNSGVFDEAFYKIRDEYGINIMSNMEYAWASVFYYKESILKNLEKKPEDRDMPQIILNTWPLIPRYFNRKYNYSIRIIKYLTMLYLENSISEIIVLLRRSFPLLKNRQQTIEFYAEILAWFFYVAQQIRIIFQASEDNNCMCSLAINGEKNKDQISNTSYKLLRVLLSHIKQEGMVLPDYSDLRIVLKKRNDPRIKDFRSILWIWSDTLKKGKISELEKVKIEVLKANKALSKISGCQKMNNWLLYFSIPSIIVDTLIGIPALGSILGVSGLGLKGTEYILKKNIQWMLFLNSP